MTRRPSSQKCFADGELVEVQPEVGEAWVKAAYGGPVTGMRGWHRVRGEALARYANTMTGMTTTADDPGACLTHLRIVPTQRIRKIGSRWIP